MVENVILTKESYVILTNLETTWKKWICDLSPKNALRVNFSTESYTSCLLGSSILHLEQHVNINCMQDNKGPYYQA